jgi:hypothetical protein
MEKISENQGWSHDYTQHCHQSEETVEEVNALSTNMDDLLSWLDQRAKYKEDQRAIKAAYKQHMNSAVKKLLYQPSWRHQQQNQGSTRQPTLKDLVKQQIRMNSEINGSLLLMIRS